MNSIKNIWLQFQKFIRFDNSLFLKISNDRYESANALIIVVFSILIIYIPIIIQSQNLNVSDIVFYGIVDGIFAWLFANLAMWFLLSRAFNTNIEISNLMIFTGYSHGVLGFFGAIVVVNRFVDLSSNTIQVLSLVIFVWMYFLISKSMRYVFTLDKRESSIATVTFLVILAWFSDPLKLFI